MGGNTGKTQSYRWQDTGKTERSTDIYDRLTDIYTRLTDKIRSVDRYTEEPKNTSPYSKQTICGRNWCQEWGVREEPALICRGGSHAVIPNTVQKGRRSCSGA